MYSANEIQVLPGLAHVRRRPQMYIGDLNRESLFEDLILESLCHAIDEAIEGRCKNIQIAEGNAIVCVQYDAGMPLTLTKSGKPIAHHLLATIGACHNLKKNIEVGSKYCQYGLAVLNALCSSFQVYTVHDGQCGQQEYIKGDSELTDEQYEEKNFTISASNEVEHTRFRFILDEELLGSHTIKLDSLQNRIGELMEDFAMQLQITVCSG
jgi:DNA gyrase/topoisomerase IV subunit B